MGCGFGGDLGTLMASIAGIGVLGPVGVYVGPALDILGEIVHAIFCTPKLGNPGFGEHIA